MLCSIIFSMHEQIAGRINFQSVARGLAVGIVTASGAAAAVGVYENYQTEPHQALVAPYVAFPQFNGAPLESHPAPEFFSGDAQSTRETLTRWERSRIPAETIKSRVIKLATAYFSVQTGFDLGKSVVVLPEADYVKKSLEGKCEDAPDLTPQKEGWLMSVIDNKLYVNGSARSAVELDALFFNYIQGLYNLAPKQNVHERGVRSYGNTTGYYEKGLIFLGRRNALETLLHSDCYLVYRRPLQQGLVANLALQLVAPLGISEPEDYPQKENAHKFRDGVLSLGVTLEELAVPFLNTQSGEFYRRVGRHLTANQTDAAFIKDQRPEALEVTVDDYFRKLFSPD